MQGYGVIPVVLRSVRTPRLNFTSAWRNFVTIHSVLCRLRAILPPVVTPEFYPSGWNDLRGAGQLLAALSRAGPAAILDPDTAVPI